MVLELRTFLDYSPYNDLKGCNIGADLALNSNGKMCIKLSEFNI